MHEIIINNNMPILIRVSTKSTSSIVIKFDKFAIQKNIPLIITDEMFDFYIYLKASETNEE